MSVEKVNPVPQGKYVPATRFQNVIYTAGMTSRKNGVLILSDPHDTADHCQDGYVVEHIDKFYSMWYDIFVMERDECTQPFVVARPPWMKGAGAI